MRNYENERTLPPITFIIDLCKLLELNVNIFIDEKLFKAYVRNAKFSDKQLAKQGLLYLLTGFGISKTVLSDSVLTELVENKALKHFIMYINPTENLDYKNSMPIVRAIVGAIDSFISCANETSDIALFFIEKLEKSLSITSEISELVSNEKVNNVINILRRNRNFADICSDNSELNELMKSVNGLLTHLAKIKSLEEIGVRTCTDMNNVIKKCNDNTVKMGNIKNIHLEEVENIYKSINLIQQRQLEETEKDPVIKFV